jgi:hypothetical protein
MPAYTVYTSEMDPVSHRLIHLTWWLRYQIDPKSGVTTSESRLEPLKGPGKSRVRTQR